MDISDTIVALSTAAGPGGRAVVRLSGPEACAVVTRIVAEEITRVRGCLARQIRLPDLPAPLPADILVWPGPRSYTGQDIVEIHTISCPPLVDLLVAELLRQGARAAESGEFTLRAFLAGKLDLPRAEAVLGVIEAGSRSELRQALAQLAGGVSRPLDGLRDDLLNLLADLEAGLDFAEEDISFVARDDLLGRLAMGMAQLTLLQKQLAERATADRPFRVVLAGRPNAGKSSLFNALTGGAALVSPEPGTTRDYLVRQVTLEGVAIDLVDTAGRRETTESIEEQAQRLGNEQADKADLVMLCLPVQVAEPELAGRGSWAGSTASLEEVESPLGESIQTPVLLVATRCDLTNTPPHGLATSAVTGAGLAELRRILAERARAHRQPALAPSLARCRHHVDACLGHLRQAHQMVLFEEPPELLAVEIRAALDQLGEMTGAVWTEELLDRVFSRFCIGK